MQITQPENSIKLPADIEKAIDAGRNNVTILTADTNRLAKLRNELNIDISNLSVRKTELEEKVKENENKKTLLENNIIELEKLINDLTIAKTNIGNDYQETIKKIKEANNGLTDRENKIIENEKEFNDRISKVILREEEAEKVKEIYEEKIKKFGLIAFELK